MGFFGTVEQRDYETLSRLTYDVDKVFPDVAELLPDDAEVVIRLREYELYERLFVFRETVQKQCIDVEVTGGGWSTITSNTYASRTSAWRKEEGPSSGWNFQIRAALDRVKQQLRERYGNVESFEDSVKEVVDDG